MYNRRNAVYQAAYRDNPTILMSLSRTGRPKYTGQTFELQRVASDMSDAVERLLVMCYFSMAILEKKVDLLSESTVT